MIYSESTTAAFTSANGLFECNSGAFGTITATSAQMGGAFYIKNSVSGFTSTGNIIRYCYLSDVGGAFHIENSKLIDSSSTMTFNAAIQGGAISCKSC